MKKTILALCLFSASTLFAAEPPPAFANETELSAVKVSGNTKSETTSAKERLEFNQDVNKEVITGRYVNSKTGTTDIGKAWDASIRYERSLSDMWSLFAQQTAESDLFAGYVQRDSTDLGAKYFVLKTVENSLLVEAGARYSRTNYFTNTPKDENTSARIYGEYSGKFNESTGGKFWVEYLPNSKDSDAYLVNYEPSVSVMMNQVFSLKIAYLVKYHNKTVTSSESKEDTTFTTAIVAKF